jgi:predicted dehydrogenase
VTVRVAVVGCGITGRRYAAVLRAAPGAEICGFLNAVRTRTPPPVPLADGTRAVAIVAALERALAEGTRVTIAA